MDRIVSIGAFEHFREERYPAFFEKCHKVLPADGRMLLHSIVREEESSLIARGLPTTHEDVLFVKFILKKIFPGGMLRSIPLIQKYAEAGGFKVTRVHPLGLNYAYTLDQWAQNLEAKKEEAIRLTSAEVYDIYMQYLTGCASYFRSTHLNVCQFTCEK